MILDDIFRTFVVVYLYIFLTYCIINIQNFNKKVRISIGASSSSKVELLTGAPLKGTRSCFVALWSPSTLHWSRGLISDFFWLADKLISVISFIWQDSIHHSLPFSSIECCCHKLQAKVNDRDYTLRTSTWLGLSDKAWSPKNSLLFFCG